MSDPTVTLSLSAVRRAAQALDDWTATYASELCDAGAVQAARGRIMAGGGTLAYICAARAPLDAAIADAAKLERTRIPRAASFMGVTSLITAILSWLFAFFRSSEWGTISFFCCAGLCISTLVARLSIIAWGHR
jgi:hypothetical protein